MKRVMFVDHAFHARTRSSDFFIALLERAFEVKVCRLEPGPIAAPDELPSPTGIDAVVLWQLDHLAPLFLALGYPTIVVPMFDGSGALPDEHWLAAREARFINFSLTLHARLEHLGCCSRLTRYFPPPSAHAERATFSSLRAFLWRRRPAEGFDTELVETLFGARLESLHVHDAPDENGIADRGVGGATSFAVRRTHWFDDRADYLQALARANVFIAPREAEGIGHAFLEAMARGMLVVANDKPTHNEYIADGINGLLFDRLNPRSLVFDSAIELGQRAWQTVADGRLQWEQTVPTMLQFIKDCAAPVPRNAAKVLANGEALSQAFYADQRAYAALLRELL